MLQSALDKATDRIKRAQAAYDRLMGAGAAGDRATVDIEAQRMAWADFLMAYSGVFETLKRGAGRDKASLEFVADAFATRNNDPLLSYLHAARNEEEHGLAPVIKMQTRAFIGGHSDGARTGQLTVLRLADEIVTGRGNKHVRPQTFQGTLIPRSTLTMAAALALGYVRSLVDRACELERSAT